MPHTDFKTILTAAGMASQKVSFHKNITIEDLSGHLPKDIADGLISVEIIPQQPVVPEISGMLMGQFVEDPQYGILSFQLIKNKEIIPPFYMKIDVFHQNKINIKIHTSLANGTTTDFLALKRYQDKFQKLQYRRFRILSPEGNTILESSCPNMNTVVSSREAEVVLKIHELEEKSGKIIGVPRTFSKPFLTSLDTLVQSWDTLTDDQRQKQFRIMDREHGTVCLTTYKVMVVGNQEEIKNLFYSEDPGWINYHSLGIRPYNKAMRAQWIQIAKSHGAIALNIRNRLHSGEEFFSLLSRRIKKDTLVLKSILSLLTDKTEEPFPMKSRITIRFHKPVEYGWNRVQHIDVVIKNEDSSLLLELESLISSGQYETAIPLLEKYKDDNLENLAFAYVLAGQYDDALSCSNEAITMYPRSIALFTKGLAYAGKGDFNAAYGFYKHAVFAVRDNWHPIAKENLMKVIEKNSIQTDEVYNRILKLLDKPRIPIKDDDKCFCNKGRKYKNCHGKTK